MELVSDFAVYKMMIHENRQKQGRIQSNFLYMSEIMRRYIDERRLYLQQSEKGLAFYVDEKNITDCFFFGENKKTSTSFERINLFWQSFWSIQRQIKGMSCRWKKIFWRQALYS